MADLAKYIDYKTILSVNILIFAEGKVVSHILRLLEEK